MKTHSDSLCTTIESFEGNENERKRAVYTLVFLQTGNMKRALKESKLSRAAHMRIVDMYKQRGHALDAERSGRPAVYTESVMKSAMAVLTTNKGTMNGPELHQQVMQKGILHSTSNRQRFLSSLRQHVRNEGHQLLANCTKTVFYISKEDEQERLTYATHLHSLLNISLSLNQLWFIDEVTIEEDPHPKGESDLVADPAVLVMYV
jgi:transposase